MKRCAILLCLSLLLISCGNETEILQTTLTPEIKLGELKAVAAAPSLTISRPVTDELIERIAKSDTEEFKRWMRNYLAWEAQGEMGDNSEEVYENLVKRWCLFIQQKKYYTRYVDAEGIVILGGDEITETVFRIARGIALDMTSKRPELREYLTPKPSSPFRMILLPRFRTGVELPEAIQTETNYLNRHGKCVGNCCFSHTSGVDAFLWRTFVHEFAHAIHSPAIQRFGDPNFNAKLESLYEKAMAAGLWEGQYAATNHSEYWAEGVSPWFFQLDDTEDWVVPKETLRRWGYFETRQDFIDYDPELAALIAEWLPAIELTFE